jgi:hypothetical protein
MLTLAIGALQFPNNTQISNPIVVDLFIKGYYEPDSDYMLIESGVNVSVNGTILASPLPMTTIDPTQFYILKAVNDLCGFVYTQPVMLAPYCQPGYTLSSDNSYCYLTSTVPATPPTAPQNTVSETNANYSLYGTFIYAPGYANDGTGPSTQISPSNGFWINPTADTTDGPLNRSGLWVASPGSNQQIGYSVCLELPTDATYLIGIGTDNYGIINIDGNNIVTQNPTTLAAQYNAMFPGIGAFVTFRIWHVYPVTLTAGAHVLELSGFNVSGPAALGTEVYNMTPAALAAATSYVGMGSGLVFSSKDFIGMPVQLGSGNIGYSCPAGYSLRYCDSPPDCVSTLITPILY